MGKKITYGEETSPHHYLHRGKGRKRWGRPEMWTRKPGMEGMHPHIISYTGAKAGRWGEGDQYRVRTNHERLATCNLMSQGKRMTVDSQPAP